MNNDTTIEHYELLKKKIKDKNINAFKAALVPIKYSKTEVVGTVKLIAEVVSLMSLGVATTSITAFDLEEVFINSLSVFIGSISLSSYLFIDVLKNSFDDEDYKELIAELKKLREILNDMCKDKPKKLVK